MAHGDANVRKCLTQNHSFTRLCCIHAHSHNLWVCPSIRPASKNRTNIDMMLAVAYGRGGRGRGRTSHSVTEYGGSAEMPSFLPSFLPPQMAKSAAAATSTRALPFSSETQYCSGRSDTDPFCLPVVHDPDLVVRKGNIGMCK